MRAKRCTGWARIVGILVAAAGTTGCPDAQLKSTETMSVGGGNPNHGISLTFNRDVDILFVIDNSGSMGEEQRNLSENFGQFLSVLEADEVNANYRIGITTTDSGNPWCPDTTPEAGKLVLSSCQSRLQDFVFQGQTEIDATDACTTVCSPQTDAVLSSMPGPFPTTPTTTRDDPQPRPRPWLERKHRAANLPDGVTTAEALQCFGPQGINGCGFESHLESMYKALVRTNLEGEDSYGFLRGNAVLSVIFVTDEADCSYNHNLQSIFLPDGDKTFWSLPDEQEAPTSAVCWNAGVRCSGAGTYDECESVDLDEYGDEVSASAAEDAAVLVPVSRYTELLQGLEDQKKAINPGQEVVVGALAGVPVGYPQTDLVYADAPEGTADDADFQSNFGIGPGCTSDVAEAVPPVRLREFADKFLLRTDDHNLFSICDTDYTEPLRTIAARIEQQFRPPCLPACAADDDPTTPVLDPRCRMVRSEPQDDGRRIEGNVAECEADGSIPADTDICYRVLFDSGLPGRTTPQTDDDVSQACRDEGWNLEFDLVRRQGTEDRLYTSYQAVCRLSDDKATDCPGLP